MEAKNPIIVVLGAGFGGLTFCQTFKHRTARVMLFDRQNHHLFQPLLYQVATARSEEHTSELQSRQYLVCRLLLEKKNTQTEHRDPGGLRNRHWQWRGAAAVS